METRVGSDIVGGDEVEGSEEHVEEEVEVVAELVYFVRQHAALKPSVG